MMGAHSTSSSHNCRAEGGSSCQTRRKRRAASSIVTNRKSSETTASQPMADCQEDCPAADNDARMRPQHPPKSEAFRKPTKGSVSRLTVVYW